MIQVGNMDSIISVRNRCDYNDEEYNQMGIYSYMNLTIDDKGKLIL